MGEVRVVNEDQNDKTKPTDWQWLLGVLKIMNQLVLEDIRRNAKVAKQATQKIVVYE